MGEIIKASVVNFIGILLKSKCSGVGNKGKTDLAISQVLASPI